MFLYKKKKITKTKAVPTLPKVFRPITLDTHIIIFGLIMMPKSYKKKKLEYFDISVYVCFIDTFRYEPRHDKTDKTSVHPAKTQISLG